MSSPTRNSSKPLEVNWADYLPLSPEAEARLKATTVAADTTRRILSARQRALLQEMEYRRCARDPWYWMTTYVKTMDPLDSLNPYKPFPKHKYLWDFLDAMRIEAVCIAKKSRQVMVTWACCAFNLHDAMFHQARNIFYQNEDQDKSNVSIERTYVLYLSQPDWIKSRHPAKKTASLIRFSATRSTITGIPQGPDTLRMNTASRIWSDEVSSQKFCGESYRAMLPTVKGSEGRRGQLVFTSTAKEGWFELLAHDKLQTESPPKPIWERTLGIGITSCKLALSGYVVLRIHYTADPTKRSQEWYEETRRGIPDDDWQQEYEINFSAKSGKPALGIFTKREKEIVIDGFSIPAYWPRWITNDYGSTNPFCFLFNTIDDDGNEYVYDEYYHTGTLDEHLEWLVSHPDYEKACDEWIIDRSCFDHSHQGTETIEGQTRHQLKSIVELIEDWFNRNPQYKFPSILPAALARDPVKIECLNDVWPADLAKPIKLFIFKYTTPNLQKEIPGIRWKELQYHQKLNANLPEKLYDKHNHAFDPLTYSRLHRKFSAVKKEPRKIPTDKEIRDDMYATISKQHMETILKRNEEEQRGYSGDGLD